MRVEARGIVVMVVAAIIMLETMFVFWGLGTVGEVGKATVMSVVVVEEAEVGVKEQE